MTTRPRALRVCGTGTALPAGVLHSDDIDRRLGLDAGTVFARYGVRRRYVTVDETAAALAVRACEQALARAAIGWDEIDCLVCASATMDQALPYNASLVLAASGRRERRIAAFDIGASCLSFVAALDLVADLVDGDRYRNVLIVSADIATFALDWSDLGESAIFGDGAAAAVVRRSRPDEPSRLLSSRLETHAEGVEYCHIRAGGSRHHPVRATGRFETLASFHMDGRRLFRLASRELPRVVDAVLADAGLTVADLRLVVPHQASRLALDHLSRRLGIEPAQMVDIFADHGNQVAASLPSALHRAVVDGRVDRGDAMLLVGTGAGVTLGAIAMVY